MMVLELEQSKPLRRDHIDMFIAIIGSRAAGKTSVRKYLETKGFRHVRVSSPEEVRTISRFFNRAHI